MHVGKMKLELQNRRINTEYMKTKTLEVYIKTRNNHMQLRLHLHMHTSFLHSSSLIMLLMMRCFQFLKANMNPKKQKFQIYIHKPTGLFSYYVIDAKKLPALKSEHSFYSRW